MGTSVFGVGDWKLRGPQAWHSAIVFRKNDVSLTKSV